MKMKFMEQILITFFDVHRNKQLLSYKTFASGGATQKGSTVPAWSLTGKNLYHCA